MSQLGLVKNPRFTGIFWTQAIGAFTDNFFKNALTLLVMYKSWSLYSMTPENVTYLASIVFFAPFFLCSATAGQLADKLEKSGLIRRLKLLEVGFALLALLGLYTGQTWVLLVVLLFFALQSSFFGPLKYGILPQLLNETELVAGNALVEMATNISILLGTIAAGEVISSLPPPWVGFILLTISCVGYLTSRWIPSSPSREPGLKVDWNPIVPTYRIIKLLREKSSIFNSVLGISWFWGLGAVILTLFPVYTKDVLGADENVVTLLLAVFSVGVGIGSLGCEKLSHGRLELGLVPLGSIGISLFCFDIYLVGTPWATESTLLTAWEFVHRGPALRILFDLFGLSVASGLFIVPLYTLIQQRARPEVRSRIIAGNNIVNSMFMVGSSLLAALLRNSGWTIPEIYAVLALTNAAVAIYVYTLIPEFFLRFVAYLVGHFLYRFKVVGEEHIPHEGPVVLVCNHVSRVDMLLVAGAVRRPIRFVMWYVYFRLPMVRFLFRDAGSIPMGNDPARPKLTEEAFASMGQAVRGGEVLCLFPEGRMCADGEMAEFRPDIEQIVAADPVPVIPMALRGLWGSNFSRHPGRFFRPSFWRAHIELVIGAPIPPAEVTAAYLRERVLELRGDRR